MPLCCFDTLIIPPFMVCSPFHLSSTQFLCCVALQVSSYSNFPLHRLCPLLTSRQHSVFVKLCFPPGIDAIVIPPFIVRAPFSPLISRVSSSCCSSGIDVIVISYFNLSSKQCLCQVVFLSGLSAVVFHLSSTQCLFVVPSSLFQRLRPRRDSLWEL